MSELIERLREAHANSQQRVLGSDIFAEAATEITRLQEALAAAEMREAKLREGLRVADEWLSGWASAEPYRAAIQQALSTSNPLPTRDAEIRKKALEAFGALCDQDAAYCGSEIHITCNSHSDAIERMRVAREVLAAIRALAEEAPK